MTSNYNVDDILAEETSSDDDENMLFDGRGKTYSQAAENDKIRRMLDKESE